MNVERLRTGQAVGATGPKPKRARAAGARAFRNGRRSVMNRLMPVLLGLCASVSIITSVGIVYTLVSETIFFFRDVPIVEFLTGTRWSPLFEPKSFGILPLLAGTLLITVIACAVAMPVGLASAIYLSEYAPRRMRNVVKPILEVLAGVPTIVYGYFALSFMTPIVRAIFPETGIFNALSAGIVVGIMIIPMVTSLSEDAMNAVPKSLRDGAYALGATKFESALKIVLPAALSGIVASFVLAFSRAVGETMIVTVAAGATPNLTFNPLESIQTMTAYIVQVSLGDTQRGSIEYGSIFAVGMALFIITFLLNSIAQYVARKFREEY